MRYDDFTIQSESYRKDFWNKMMKGQTAPYETMNKGAISSDTYVLPYDSNRKYMDVLKEECIFRQLATSIKLRIPILISGCPTVTNKQNGHRAIRSSLSRMQLASSIRKR